MSEQPIVKERKKRGPYKRRASNEAIERAVLLVIRYNHTIAEAQAATGVTRYLIRKGLNTYGANGVDMGDYSRNSQENWDRRKRIVETVNGEAGGSFAKAARALGISRQRVFQIYKKYNRDNPVDALTQV